MPQRHTRKTLKTLAWVLLVFILFISVLFVFVSISGAVVYYVYFAPDSTASGKSNITASTWGSCDRPRCESGVIQGMPEEWSQPYAININYGPDFRPTQDGILDVRVNGSDEWTYQVDAFNQRVFQGQLIDSEHPWKGPPVRYIQVRAANRDSIGQGFIAAMVAMKRK